MNFIMAVRDYRELAKGPFEMVPFDLEFDIARAVKSEEELVEVRDAMDIIVDGFWALVAAYEPGKTEAEIMAPAVERFFARGAGPRMMNILLSGSHGEAEASFKVPGHRVTAVDDLLLYSLEVTGAGGYWVEFSRPLIRGKLSLRTQAMADAYPHALEAARKLMRAGELASSVHRVVAETFAKYGFALGHLSGHSIGTTMLSIPRSAQRATCSFRKTVPCIPRSSTRTAKCASIRKTRIASARRKASAWQMCRGSFTLARRDP